MVRTGFLFAAVLALAFSAGAAQAELDEATPAPALTPPTGMLLLSRPAPHDFARVYPARALRNGVGGVVVLDCLVLEGGLLQCEVLSEDPTGYGFGRAALSLAPEFRAALQTRDGRSTIGGRAHIPLTFSVR